MLLNYNLEVAICKPGGLVKTGEQVSLTLAEQYEQWRHAEKYDNRQSNPFYFENIIAFLITHVTL